jgi:hypothetical protein
MIIDEESLPYTNFQSSYREKLKLCSITLQWSLCVLCLERVFECVGACGLSWKSTHYFTRFCLFIFESFCNYIDCNLREKRRFGLAWSACLCQMLHLSFAPRSWKYSVMIIDEESLPYTSVHSSYREKSNLCSITFAMIALVRFAWSAYSNASALADCHKVPLFTSLVSVSYLRIFLQLYWLQFARKATFWSWLKCVFASNATSLLCSTFSEVFFINKLDGYRSRDAIKQDFEDSSPSREYEEDRLHKRLFKCVSSRELFSSSTLHFTRFFPVIADALCVQTDRHL